MMPSHPNPTARRANALLPTLTFAFALALASTLPTQSCAATNPPPARSSPKPRPEPKTWTRFNACSYVDHPANDADSFRVRCGDREIHVRLYFVDSPESRGTDAPRVAEQARHFNLSTQATLAAGSRAAQATRAFLGRQSFTVHTRWTVAGGRSREPRYYATVTANGQDLAAWLVQNGWARTKGAVAPSPDGEPSKSVMDRLRRLEGEARRRGAGAWTNPSSATRSSPAPAAPR